MSGEDHVFTLLAAGLRVIGPTGSSEAFRDVGRPSASCSLRSLFARCCGVVFFVVCVRAFLGGGVLRGRALRCGGIFLWSCLLRGCARAGGLLIGGTDIVPDHEACNQQRNENCDRADDRNEVALFRLGLPRLTRR